MWDVRTGTEVAGPFKGHTDWVRSVAFSPDGNHIVSGSDDQTIRVWDVNTGTTVAGPFLGHDAEVHSVAFSPNGRHIISGSLDETILVWDVDSGQPVTNPLEGHIGAITSVSFSPDGNSCASSSDDGTIRIWDIMVSSYLIYLPGSTNSTRLLSMIVYPAFSFRHFIFQSDLKDEKWMDPWS